MLELDDNALLREYSGSGSEEAFASLVKRHVNKVYSAALRHTGNPHQAEEIAQAVFILLAQKAGQLGKNVILEGWLYHTTRLTALTLIRGNIRRGAREKEAHIQTAVNENEKESDVWAQIAPLLDAALAGLNETDRHAIVLRFFYDKSLKEVGAALGASESAATVRLHRALQKLRRFFFKHGVNSTAAVISQAMAAHSVQPAPVALAKSITAAAITKGIAAGASTTTLVNGALKIMAWTKAKAAVAAGIGIMFVIGATTAAVEKYEAYQARIYSWRVPYPTAVTLRQATPQVKILPTKFKAPISWQSWAPADRYGGVRVTVAELARIAYRWTPGRIIFPAGQPAQRYDFVTTVPESPKDALKAELQKTLGFVGRVEAQDTDVLVLKVQNANSPGLKEHDPRRGSAAYAEPQGHIVNVGRPISTAPPELPLGLPKLLEEFFRQPVIDETGLNGRYDIDIRWDEDGSQDHAALKKVLLDELGLELVPGRRTVDMLIMEKTR